jgi:valyl-tRNA synthetase
VEEVSSALENYDFHDAAQALYRFTWDDFCDWYVESAKFRLRLGEDAGEGSEEAAEASRVRATLAETLSVLLRLLHPFTPFLSEALWSHLPRDGEKGLLMGADWPEKGGENSADPEAEALFEHLQDAVRGFRNIRALLELTPSQKPEGTVACVDASLAESLGSESGLLAFLAGLGGIETREGGEAEWAATDVFRGGSVFLPLDEDADLARLQDSLARKLVKVEKGILGVESKLGNAKFLARAGEDVVDSEKARLEELRVEQRTLEANQDAFLRNLGSAPGT